MRCSTALYVIALPHLADRRPLLRRPAHVAMARTIAAESAILLQNERNTLPINALKYVRAGQRACVRCCCRLAQRMKPNAPLVDRYKRIAIVGKACDPVNDIPRLISQWDLGE